MGIAKYIKEIGRGKEGARALNREQAADLMGQVLDGAVTDLEVGAFCLAMRIKGETAQEMAGFLDATRQRMQLVPNADQPTVVLPSYNGARKLPVLTPCWPCCWRARGWLCWCMAWPLKPAGLRHKMCLKPLVLGQS
jgi:anthranilate phosphoribosyltransferase